MDFKPLSVDEYLSLTFPANDIIDSGILTKQSVLVVGGHPGVGKSVLSAQLGIEVSLGKEIFDTFKSKKSRVLYIQEEIGPRSYQDRLEKVISYYGRSDGFFIISSASFSFDDPALVQKLKGFIIKHQIDIVIFDPLYKVHTRRESDPTEMTQLVQLVSRLINELGISVILVHHLRKPFMTYKGEIVSMGILDFRGATVIPAWADTMMLLEETDIKDRLRLSFPKLRNAPEDVKPLHLNFDRKHLRFVPIKDGSQPFSVQEDILSILTVNGGISEGNVVSQIKAKYGSKLDSKKVKTGLQTLKQKGAVIASGGLLKLDPGYSPTNDDAWDTAW